MKAERRFWTDAMQEIVRPQIDLLVNVSLSEASTAGRVMGYQKLTWWDTKSCDTAYNIRAERTNYYANMLNGNGFRLGDSRCLLNDANATYYEPLYQGSCAISPVSNGASIEMFSSSVSVTLNGKYIDLYCKHYIRLWNVRDVTVQVDAMDGVALTSNVIATAYRVIDNDDYMREYLVELDLPALFPGWDSTYKGIKISCQVPMGERIFYAGYFYDNYSVYRTWGVQDIVSLNYDEGLELLSAEVPHQTLSLTVYDEQGEFDPTNPNGYYDMLGNMMPIIAYLGIDGAYLSPTILYSTGDVRYNKKQLTIEFDTEWQANKTATFIPSVFTGDVEDSLQQYSAWYESSINNSLSGYKTNTATSEDQWKGELDQLRLSSVGAFAVYNETYNVATQRRACKATEIPNLIAEDYHVRARDMRDGYATLERKALLGNVKVKKYDYVITSETKSVSQAGSLEYPSINVSVALPQWAKHCAKFEMTWGYPMAVDENGANVPHQNLNWNISNNIYSGVHITVSHTDGVTKLTDAGIKGTLYYWAQEDVSVAEERVNEQGEECYIDNPFVTTDEQVQAVIDGVKFVYGHRDTYVVQWAQDWRVELGDIIYLDTQFESNVKVVVVGLKFSYPGLWGEITVRRID